MPKAYDERLHDALKAVHSRFFSAAPMRLRDDYAFFLDSCPVCAGKSLHQAMRKDGFLFDRCMSCGMVFLNPRLNDAATYAFYDSEWIRIYNECKFHGATAANDADRNENRHLLELLGEHGDLEGSELLEVGPGGEGTFINEALAKGCRVTAIELGEDNCSHLEKRFGNTITLLRTTLENAGLADAAFDFVSMRDVLEHIPNPMTFLKEVTRILKPGGVLLIHVPNIEGLVYKLLGARHTVVFGFEHPNYWSPKSLARALDLCGMAVLRQEHSSSDFTVGTLCEYWFGPSTFTTVHKKERTRAAVWLNRLFGRFFSLGPVRRADALLTPMIADRLAKRGSTITMIARKT